MVYGFLLKSPFLTKPASNKVVRTLIASFINQKGRKLSFCFPALANFDALSVISWEKETGFYTIFGYSMRHPLC